MLIDTTLREGAQLFGAYFDHTIKEGIATALVRLGIEELELGWVGQEGLAPLAQSLRQLGAKTRLSVWTPCRDRDIRTAAALGLDRVNIGVPVSDLHMKKRLGLDREALLERLASTILAARLLGVRYVSVGFEDISRADRDFALRAALTAQDMGASRVRLSDSLGLLTPQETTELTGFFRQHLSIDLAVHCHNDFGMGTANALAGLQAGADYADASVLGIGERSGIAATEELAAYLALRKGTGDYRTEELRELCQQVSEAADIHIPRTKPVAGRHIFSCESGIHAHALNKSPKLFEPYDPDRIGSDRTVAVGGKSGHAAIADALRRTHPEAAHDVSELLASVRSLSMQLRRPLTEPEFARLAHSKNRSRSC